MRIAVLTDVHANLPALQAALDAIHRAGCEAIYHTGDAIAIGPHPAECLDLLLSTPNLHLTMGNHDAWFVQGLPQPRPSWMDDGEVEHHHWVYAQLDPDLKRVIAGWPWVIQESFETTLADENRQRRHHETEIALLERRCDPGDCPLSKCAGRPRKKRT